MKKLLQTIILAFIVSVSYVSAQTVAVETFDYATGNAKDLGVAGNGWGGAWTLGATAISDSIKIVAGSIGFTGLKTTGNKLEIRSLAAAGSEISRALATTWADVAGAEYWISFLFQVTNTPANNDSWQGFSLDNAGEQAYIGKLWGQDKFGLNDPSPYLNVPTAIAYTSGVAWIVTKIKMSGAAGVDTAFMWINHDPSKVPTSQEANIKADITLDNGFNSIRLHLGQTAGIKEAFDEIRIGKSWADVTSPITTAILSKTIDNSLVTVLNNRGSNVVTFNYTLKTDQVVKLEIFNVQGQVISTLINGNQSSGLQNINWNTSNVQKGLYFFRLKVGDSYQTGKILF